MRDLDLKPVHRRPDAAFARQRQTRVAGASRRWRWVAIGALLLAGLGLAALALGSPVLAQTVPGPPEATAAVRTAEQTWAVHGQITFVDQGTLAFRSPNVGPNSLDPGARGREMSDVTLYVGYRPWTGAEL